MFKYIIVLEIVVEVVDNEEVLENVSVNGSLEVEEVMMEH